MTTRLTYFYLTGGFLVGLMTAMGLVVTAYQGPTQAFPNSNIPAPLNVGNQPQSKDAGLALNALNTYVVGLSVKGNVGINESVPTTSLHVGNQNGATGDIKLYGSIKGTRNINGERNFVDLNAGSGVYDGERVFLGSDDSFYLSFNSDNKNTAVPNKLFLGQGNLYVSGNFESLFTFTDDAKFKIGKCDPDLAGDCIAGGALDISGYGPDPIAERVIGGLVVPRLTEGDRDSLIAAKKGVGTIIYNTTDNQFNFRMKDAIGVDVWACLTQAGTFSLGC